MEGNDTCLKTTEHWRPEKKRNAVELGQVSPPDRKAECTECRWSSASVSPALATWPSTLGLPRAPRAPLQPPRPPRVSDPLGPSPGEERPLVRPLGPDFPAWISCRRGDFRGIGKGRAAAERAEAAARRPEGRSRPVPELARLAWVPAEPYPRVRSPRRGVGPEETGARLPSSLAGDPPSTPQAASGTGGNARVVPAAGRIGLGRPGLLPRCSLGPTGSQPQRVGSSGPGPLVLVSGLHAPAPFY